MKKFLPLLLLLFIFSCSILTAKKSVHGPTYKGFYASLAAGPSLGVTSYSDKSSYLGAAYNIDARAGYVLEKNVIFFGNLCTAGVNGFTEPYDDDYDGNYDQPEHLVARSFTLGGGIVYYMPKTNYYYSLAAGAVYLSTQQDPKPAISDKPGFGVSIRAGTESWISKNYSLGWGLGISYASVKNTLPVGDNSGGIFLFTVFMSGAYN